MDLDLKAKLLMGLNISTHGITIKNYTIGEIFGTIGLTKYLQMSSISNRDVKDYIAREYLYQFKTVSVFDVFCMTQEMNDMFIEFLNLFTGYEWKFISNDTFTEFYAKNEYGNNVHVNRENIHSIFDVVKAMYCLDSSKKESDRDDIDDEMRELLREFEEEEAKVNASKGSKVTIVSIIDGISAKHNSINLLNIWKYKMYQIIHTYYILNKIDNENRIMTAIYTGVMDSKKTDVEKTYWAGEIDT